MFIVYGMANLIVESFWITGLILHFDFCVLFRSFSGVLSQQSDCNTKTFILNKHLGANRTLMMPFWRMLQCGNNIHKEFQPDVFCITLTLLTQCLDPWAKNVSVFWANILRSLTAREQGTQNKQTIFLMRHVGCGQGATAQIKNVHILHPQK